jgi:DNA modification methylase
MTEKLIKKPIDLEEAVDDPVVKQIQEIGNSEKYQHILSYQLPDALDAGSEETFPMWKKVPKSSASPLHSMMSRAGSFPPSLARYFIIGYSEPGELIFDPFCGKGTAVLQAVLDGRRVVGSDVAPEAVIVSQAKVTPITLAEIESYLDRFQVEPKLVDKVPEKVRTFFHDDTLSQLLGVRDKLIADVKPDDADSQRAAIFLLGCLLGILHGHASYSLSLQCSHAYAMAPNYVQRYVEKHGLEKPKRNVIECLLQKSKLMLSKDNISLDQGNLAKVFETGAEKYSTEMRSEVAQGVSLILTSPPYLNAQTYAKDAWLRLWLLGYDHRKVRSRFIQTGSIEKYKEQMRPCLREMLKVLKPEAHAFLVAGDVYQRRKGEKRLVKTAEILAEVAETVEPQDGFAFKVQRIIDDTIPNHARYYAAVHGDAKANWSYNGEGTGVRIDRILHLRKAPNTQGI